MRVTQTRLEQALALLRHATHAVALTGAGISTPSGIPDFRSQDAGVWQAVDPFEVASIYAFRQRPQAFYDWIRPLASKILAASPNPAHLALADLESFGPVKSIITQNIDLLHDRAGSRTVYEVHGHIREVTCIGCYGILEAAPFMAQLLETGAVPHCPGCGGVLKPNVILFGEQLPIRVLNQARLAARVCDLMLIAGSSLEVAPAGDLPLLARETGAHLIIVNRTPTILDDWADVVIHGEVEEVLPQLAAPFLPLDGTASAAGR